jgi:hypothetical protein
MPTRLVASVVLSLAITRRTAPDIDHGQTEVDFVTHAYRTIEAMTRRC